MGAIVKPESADIIEFTPDKVALIKRVIAKGATDDEMALFLHQCQRTGLDPLARQIYFQKYGNNMTIITGIDGYRLVADRTGKYVGSDEPVFDGRQKEGNVDVPVKATVTVWKLVSGQRCPFSASAYWSEYYPGEKLGHMWRKMPHVMLAKCAEALALRKAFPADLSGVYTREEMEQAGDEIVTASFTVQPPTPAQQPNGNGPHSLDELPSDAGGVDNPFVDENPARGRFHFEVGSTFGGMDVDAARHWLIEGWTKKNSPDNIRKSATDLTNDEMDAIADGLKENRAKIRRQFEAFQAKAKQPDANLTT